MKGKYIDNKLKGKMPKKSNFCVQNHLSDRTCLINIVLIRHYNWTIESSNKRQAGHVWPWYDMFDISDFNVVTSPTPSTSLWHINVCLCQQKQLFTQANILWFYCCQSHVWKILDFTKMNLSSLKISRKRKENLKISGSSHLGVCTPAGTHTTCKYSI
jgi:hypothetical protein